MAKNNKLDKAWQSYAKENEISSDKRTKEYKEFKSNFNKSEGLGDTVEKITKATGIKKAVEFFNEGEPCEACERRRQKWNNVFRYKKPKELTLEEFATLYEFFSRVKNTISSDEQKMLIVIYNRVFSAKKRFSRCTPCVRGMIDSLRKIYNEY